MTDMSRDYSAAVQQRQVSGNTHVFDRPRASASVSSALLTELNTTLNCLKVPHVSAGLLCCVFMVWQDAGISGASGDLAHDEQCGVEEVLQHTLRICRCDAAALAPCRRARRSVLIAVIQDACYACGAA